MIGGGQARRSGADDCYFLGTGRFRLGRWHLAMIPGVALQGPHVDRAIPRGAVALLHAKPRANAPTGGWEVSGTYPDCTCNYICPEGGYDEAQPAETEEESADEETSDESAAAFATVTHAYVDAVPVNWDGDPAMDGIIVYPKLKDASDESVHYEGINIPVDIEVWTMKFDENMVEVKDRRIYSTSLILKLVL